MPHQQKHSGFSLLELILVVVLLGVLASGAGLLISTPIEAYNDQLRRQQLVDQAETALRLIARDVRRALPNSLRVSGDALEMINTVDGARYRDENATATATATDDEVLDFATADPEFNFLGRLNSLTALSANHRLVIYNTTDDIYTFAEGGAATGIITPADSLTLTSPSSPYSNEDHIVMDPAFQFTQQSPGQRAFIVDGPISYICDT
ncbi:MAG: prepilin-type N-terminal cleavage/methylation domain-containing protein, partial [Gammaproteobacteria bacterium]|nr:prepilin-type N-terminal cleavage/methylation domain-containing protein [Gammaproteobacteria bacterium]